MMAATLAASGKNPVTGKQVMDAAKVPGVLAVMATAGLYDDSGKWLYQTGTAREERRRWRHHRRLAGQVRHRRRVAAARRRGQQRARAAGDCRHLELARRQPLQGGDEIGPPPATTANSEPPTPKHLRADRPGMVGSWRLEVARPLASPSFRPQHLQRIDPRGAPRRDPGGEQRHAGHDDGDHRGDRGGA